MRIVAQRVTHASVTIDGKVKSEIGLGMLVLLGIEEADNEEDVEWLCQKLTKLRIFDDGNDSMNFDINQVGGSFLVVRPWTQFFKPEDREDMPLSQCNNIYFKNINMTCKNFFDVGKSDKYRLVDFSFENINVVDQKKAFDPQLIENCSVRNVEIK
jgi:hypothetical protein